jgi:alpha-tubulin suppressor-like RCC1 family protein
MRRPSRGDPRRSLLVVGAASLILLASASTSESAASAPDDAAAAPPSPVLFYSPSRNIVCEVSDDAHLVGVYCQSYEPPHNARLNAAGRVTTCRGVRCVGDPGDAIRPITLGYGRQRTVGRFRCRSEQVGVTCTVASTRKGFRINRSGTRRVGATAAAPADQAGGAAGPAPRITQITTGWRHTCAITSTGRVKCWGSNGFGQLGDGSRTSRSRPVDVVGLSGITAITAGTNHTCALTGGGGVKCWGNLSGFLREPVPAKDGATTTPVDISGVTSGVTQIAGGDYSTCGRMSTGAVRCWAGSVASSRASIPVRSLPGGVRAVGGGYPHCAVAGSGGITCWYPGGPAGARGSQAGSFTAVSSGRAFYGVDGGTAPGEGYNHICGLTTAGGVKCWGDNSGGQLGNGGSTASTSPVDVSGLTSGVTAVDAGLSYACAVTSAGGVMCWGGGRRGNLGNGTTVDAQRTPVAVTGLGSGISAISASGDGHTCALTNAGRVKCWGDGRGGQLGNGRFAVSSVPVDVVWSRG